MLGNTTLFHRHGKVDFGDLARLVAKHWDELPENEKETYACTTIQTARSEKPPSRAIVENDESSSSSVSSEKQAEQLQQPIQHEQQQQQDDEEAEPPLVLPTTAVPQWPNPRMTAQTPIADFIRRQSRPRRGKTRRIHRAVPRYM